MWYRGSVTVPAGTTKADYASAVVEICQGRIQKFYRLFPPGCGGFVSLQVYYQTRQIFPTTPGEAYIGDGSEILGDSSVEIDEPPFEVELRAWSPNATYDHIVYCEFYIERPRVIQVTSIERVVVPGV